MKYLSPLSVVFLSFLFSGFGCGPGDSAASAHGGADESEGASSDRGDGARSEAEAAAAPDPAADGPYAIAEIDDSIKVAATSDKVAIHCAYPSAGPSAGPYPVVVVGHGFQLPSSQYYLYVRRLATFGYVALTVDFPGSIFQGVNNVKAAKDLLAGVDWAAAKPTLHGKVDASNVGMTGHSLGGKVALLAATMDPRVKAAIALDPVNSSLNCSAQDCPDVVSLMPSLHIPTGFVGETNSAGQTNDAACAPEAANFTKFYAKATSPSVSVAVLGGTHMSFLGDMNNCFQCWFCNQHAAVPHDQILSLSRSYVVAFYERYLRGKADYDAYLTGAIAQSRYVTPGTAAIESK